MGDVNKDIKTNSKDAKSTDYLDLIIIIYSLLLIVRDNKFWLLICKCFFFLTRKENCIDHKHIRIKSTVFSFDIQSPITDHLPVLLCLASNNPNIPNPHITYRKFNYDIIIKSQFKNDSDLIYILHLNNADIAALTLIHVFSRAIELDSISRTVPCRQRISKPWITTGQLRCIRHRDSMHLKVTKNPNSLILSKSYRKYRNVCNNLLDNKTKIN